ncbi:hypothetical protein AB162_313 [Candidatus Palibaumannia cicadellinicola]|uniref:Uncharacterized protein n=1 Tax=Candidatus Palibaumannia cicadellinicola TaxID=186490 RepID=A0A0K2BL31_9GAMM|nr:hypothetical protein AB162_313 [Candidatus Baumannia cicadellinicola]
MINTCNFSFEGYGPTKIRVILPSIGKEGDVYTGYPANSS